MTKYKVVGNGFSYRVKYKTKWNPFWLFVGYDSDTPYFSTFEDAVSACKRWEHTDLINSSKWEDM